MENQQKSSPSQPSYLTLTETVFSFAIIMSLGYWIGGCVGTWIGAAIVAVYYAQAILRAAYSEEPK